MGKTGQLSASTENAARKYRVRALLVQADFSFLDRQIDVMHRCGAMAVKIMFRLLQVFFRGMK